MNRLHRWYLPLKDKKMSVRCYSHVATHPKDVPEWVPINLKELGTTVAFDKRSCQLMHGHQVGFLVHKDTDMLKAVELV